MRMNMRYKLGGMTCAAVLTVAFALPAFADVYSGGSYIVNGVIGNSGGDSTSGGSYNLSYASGESVIGNGGGGSYILGAGYVAQLAGVPTMRLDVQPGGLAAYYALNEGSGSGVSDASATKLNGNTNGAPAWVSGKIGKALSFNGSSQYVASASYSITGPLTVEAWVYPTAASETASAVSDNTNTTDNQSQLGLVNSNANFAITIGGKPVSVSGAAVAQNTWTHLVGVYDGTNVLLYVNGALAGSAAATGTVATNSLPWTIGKTAGAASGYFTGNIDEVKIYSRALSANEVSAEYNAQNSGTTSGVAFAGGITPGASQTSDVNTYVTTNTAGYSLAVNEDHDLQNGAYTIPAISSGTIASPAAWNEGSTKGLGFTLTSAPNLSGTWGSGANYAALPTSATTFYTRSGATLNTRETIALQIRADVTSSQPSGNYQNNITITGTALP